MLGDRCNLSGRRGRRYRLDLFHRRCRRLGTEHVQFRFSGRGGLVYRRRFEGRGRCRDDGGIQLLCLDDLGDRIGTRSHRGRRGLVAEQTMQAVLDVFAVVAVQLDTGVHQRPGLGRRRSRDARGLTPRCDWGRRGALGAAGASAEAVSGEGAGLSPIRASNSLSVRASMFSPAKISGKSDFLGTALDGFCCSRPSDSDTETLS